MKKFILLLCVITIALSVSAFASGNKITVQKNRENLIKVVVSSDSKIKVTGYTISDGSNIIVYYIKNDKGTNTDSISVNLNTVIRPYKVILMDGTQPPTVQPFKDIKDSEFKDYIRHLYDSGFIKGYEEDNTFRPDNNITRAELITMVSRMLELKENPKNRKHFEDLSEKHWAYGDVVKAVDNGVIDGYEEEGKSLVKLENNVTMAEVIKIVDEAFKIKNKSNLNYDVRFVNHWAKGNVQSLLNSNVVAPEDDFYKKGELDRPAKRGEVAMLLSRALGR